MAVVQREDGAAIAWYDEGEGAPVLLVMGLAYPAASWFRQVPALVAGGHRVLTVDNRGCGGTGLAPGAPYTVELMTDDLRAVLDAAGEASAHVVGISMGGLMAQELALTSPERVRSLVLMASHPGMAHGVWPQEVFEFLGARATVPAQDQPEFSIPFNYAPATSRVVIEEDWAVRKDGTAGPEGYAAQGGTALWSGWERLPSLAVPTLVVAGDNDRLVVAANAQKIADAVPDAKLVIVEGANHVLTTDQPEQVNQLLLDWMARHP